MLVRSQGLRLKLQQWLTEFEALSKTVSILSSNPLLHRFLLEKLQNLATKMRSFASVVKTGSSSSQKEVSSSTSTSPSTRQREIETDRSSTLPKSTLPEPVVEKGTATHEYEILDTGEDVCHGTLSGDFVSFIRYDTIEKAQMSQSLLQRFSTDEFINPLMVISSKPNVWLVVPKIDYTLDQFKKKNTRIWSSDYLLDDKFKIIVRDIIVGAIQLVNQGYSMRELMIGDIAIINGRAKLMRISNKLGASKLRDQLHNILKDLLGNDSDNKELSNFYCHMKEMPMYKLIHLRNHPILLTSQERLQFPVLLLKLLNYEKKSSNWKVDYDDKYKGEEDTKAKALEKDKKHKVMYNKISDQKWVVNYIATKVEKDEAYKKAYYHENRVYPNTASSQITFSRNVIIHINDDGKYRTREEVGEKLKNFFPDLWARLFSLMICEGLDVWDQRNEKYGGDLPSHWRATLELCILENDDLATEHFLKICRSFFSLLVMKADRGVAISTLVDTITKQINTVELKFFQDKFKYRKLEGIFKDDNFCSTSTKLAENNCTNCINFLMRFLKFIALLLHDYSPNCNVKKMFEDAYSSLLEDDPDLKKKRKEESLEEHRNLLENVPSNEEFKSLLGNPKNIKDCGSVALSLMTLKYRWNKLLNEKNANKKQGAGGGIVAPTSAVAETETIAGAGEARVVGASSGDSTVCDGTNSQCVVVPTVEKAIQRVQSKEKKKKKNKKKKP